MKKQKQVAFNLDDYKLYEDLKEKGVLSSKIKSFSDFVHEAFNDLVDKIREKRDLVKKRV